MAQRETLQKLKGIWITRDDEVPLYYSTWLRERTEEVVGFIPFEHSYDPGYLGSVGFLDLSDPNLDFSRHNLTEGILQNQFYPLGGTALETRPELVGKGLARKIEFEIAKDLLEKLPQDTPVAIGASSDSHKEYCRRIGITPWQQMSLCDYVKLLDR